MGKERLEELESKYSTIDITSERDGVEYTEIDIRDLVFLMQYGFRQTERMQELGKESKLYCGERCRKARLFYDDYGI